MKHIYKGIKIAGLIVFMPVILFTGPFTGYIVGQFLEEKFNKHWNFTLIFAIIGMVASIYEVIRIIKLLVNIENSNGH